MNEIKSSFLSTFDSIDHGIFYGPENALRENGKLSKFRYIKTLDQIHSDTIIHFDNNHAEESVISGDAMYTMSGGTCLGIYTADCVPVMLYEPERRIVAAVHAGWRGTVSRISAKAVRKMEQTVSFNPETAFAVIGPSIGKCCYEVDVDVAARFMDNLADHAEYVHEGKNGKYLIDLVEANICQLRRSGIQNIEAMHICTSCNTHIPSYRRDGSQTGKIFSYIGLV